LLGQRRPGDALRRKHEATRPPLPPAAECRGRAVLGSLTLRCRPGESRGPYSRGLCLWVPAFARTTFKSFTSFSRWLSVCLRASVVQGNGLIPRLLAKMWGSPHSPARMNDTPCRVGLFVTCLVDLFRPSVGFAAVKLLEAAGCTVEVPAAQTCCGQPAYNSGDCADARAIAAQVIAAFQPCDYVVVPSGSVRGMPPDPSPALFAADPAMQARARTLAARTHELISFLTDVRGMTRVESRYHGTITYHDSCSGLRELGIKQQPRRLLASVAGLKL